MFKSDKCFLRTITAAALFALAGCSGSDGPSEETGFLSLGVSDGPVHDAEKVCIEFNEIEFFSAAEGSITVALDPAEKVDLLDFQGANAAPLLFDEELPAGNYQWMRLGINASLGSNGGLGNTDDPGCQGAASYIAMSDGNVYNLYVPSGAETGLKLVSGFTVPVNGSADFTADWDLMQSITAPPGLSPDMVLRPTIRLVNNVEVGTLTGKVANDLATAEACDASVYVFDDGITPNAIDTESDDPNDPIATAMVNAQTNDDGSTSYHYSVGFLLAGNYEAAFTCDGINFEPAAGKPAEIVAQQTTTVDFP